jgi:hypothetical protein
MQSEDKHYLAYMLRLWRADDADAPIWRASLESPHTGERHGFHDLEALFAFLKEEIHRQYNRDPIAPSSPRDQEA